MIKLSKNFHNLMIKINIYDKIINFEEYNNYSFYHKYITFYI